jgi:hypothetical protein
MRARKLLVVGLVAGLVVGSLGTSVEAKKKKKKLVPTPVSYFIQRVPAGSCADEASYFLSVTPGADNGACGNLGFGVIAEVTSQIGEDDLVSPAYVFAARDGVPFVLDATKPLTGKITVKSASAIQGQALVPHGVGQTTLQIAVTGTTNGTSTELGTATATYLVTPNSQPAPVEFTITLDAALNKASFTTLELHLRNRGASVQHGYYASGNQSFVTVPTLVKK